MLCKTEAKAKFESKSQLLPEGEGAMAVLCKTEAKAKFESKSQRHVYDCAGLLRCVRPKLRQSLKANHNALAASTSSISVV